MDEATGIARRARRTLHVFLEVNISWRGLKRFSARLDRLSSGQCQRGGHLAQLSLPI